jgi:XTP/dITP diphosphohydrolase
LIIYASSSNKGKLREFALASRESGFTDLVIEPLPGLDKIGPPDESGTTFEENAVLKALYYSYFSPEIVLAEDSGLEVAALGGAPGIFSARFARENATFGENNSFLLQKLKGQSDRAARFITASALARRGKLVAQGTGIVEGIILEEPRGQNGFGYDPLFFYPPLSRSFAELSDEEKFSVSARGNSLRTLFRSFAKTDSNPIKYE